MAASVDVEFAVDPLKHDKDENNKPKSERVPTEVFVFHCFTAIIQALQMASLPWGAGAGSASGPVWPLWMQDFAQIVSLTRLNVTAGPVYVGMFTVFASIISGFIVLFILAQVMVALFDCCDACWGSVFEHEEVWMFVANNIVFGILFIPVLAMSLEMLHCTDTELLWKDPGIVCWAGGHVGLVALAIITLVVLGGSGLVIFVLRNRAIHYDGAWGRQRKSVNYFDLKVFFYRFVLVVVNVWVGSVSSIAAIVISFVASILPIVGIFYYLPHLEGRYNTLKMFRFSFGCWAFFCTLIAAGSPVAAVIFLFVGSPLFCTLLMVLTTKQNVRRPPGDEEYQSQGTGNLKHHDDPLVVRFAEEEKLPSDKCAAIVHADAQGLGQWLQSTLSRDDLVGICVKRSDPLTSKQQTATENVRVLAELLSKQPNLTNLSIEGQRLTTENSSALIDALVQHPSIAKLDLYKCHIHDEFAMLLVTSLAERTITTLRRVNLGGNQVSAKARETILGIKAHFHVTM